MKYLFWIICMICLISCTGSHNDAGAAYPENYPSEAKTAEASYLDQSAAPDEDQMTSSETPVPEKKVIKTANLQLEVKKLYAARTALDTLVKKYNAEIVNETQNSEYNRIDNSLVIRVLPDNFEALIADVEKLAVNVQYKQINAQDVTKQFVDLETRLQTKRDVIARYREILKTAKTVTDILAVEEKLRLVIEEVESIEAQLKYLRDQVGMSSVNVTMYELTERSQADKRSFWDRLGSSLAGGWQLLLELLLGIARAWPVVILLTLFVWWIVRRITRRPK